MSVESLQSMIAVAIGFAVAGLFASGYRIFTSKLPSFGLLQAGPTGTVFAALPVLLFSAPFIIMRNTLLGRRYESRRFELVFAATVIAGLWSLMSGTVVVAALRASGLFG